MSKKTLPPPGPDYLAEMSAALHDESERGTVLILSAWVDDALTGLVKASVVQHEKAINEMFGVMRPLSSFASKTHIAILMGLIDERLYGALNGIRTIRNLFAHSREDIGFAHEGVQNECRKLPFLSPDEHDWARKTFVVTGVIATYYLIRRRGQTSLTPLDRTHFANFARELGDKIKTLINRQAKGAAGGENQETASS